MNWKKLEVLYVEAFKTGEKDKARSYVELVLEELNRRQAKVIEFGG